MTTTGFDIETVVLTREYLESVHGRMTFADAEDGEESAAETPARLTTPEHERATAPAGSTPR